ncbi:hypothetical protein GCM10010517_28140 [Streptosporangium fragile]|uniref:Uncharacterized protein n=1 Tax=Streptosporangium fragile TaxID=46186 RepID=A0ABN3VW57_9ACTN
MTDNRDETEDPTRWSTPEKDPPSSGPRDVDTETRVVAERSGSDTSFPERPLPADPEDALRTREGRPGGADRVLADQTAEDEEPGGVRPDVGPAS